MKVIFTLMFVTISIYVNAQHLKKHFIITVKDNHNFQYLENYYRLTKDSLVISAINDKGETHVDYLKRKLTKAEKKSLSAFLSIYSIDSLLPEYFSDYNNFRYISYDHYPRVFNIEFESPAVHKKVKVTNCYVYRVANLIGFLNAMIPDEVKIKYIKNDFEKLY